MRIRDPELESVIGPITFIVDIPTARAPALFSLLARMPTGAVGLVLPLLAVQTGLGIGVGGVAFACCRVVHAGAGPVWGRIVDRTGVRMSVAVGTAGFALAATLLATIPLTAVSFLLTAALLGAFILPIPAIMRSLWNRRLDEQHERDAANAYESVMTELTLLLARGFIALLALVVSLPVIMTILAGLALTGGLGLVFTSLVRSDTGLDRRQGVVPSVTALWSGKKIFALYFLLSASLGSFSICLIDIAPNPTLASLSVAAWGVGSVVGVMVGRADRLARRTLGMPAMLIVMASLQTVASIMAESATAILFIAFAAGLPIAGCVTELYRRLAVYTPKGGDTEFFAWAVTVLLLGDAVGAFVGAVSAENDAIILGSAGAAGLFALIASGIALTLRPGP